MAQPPPADGDAIEWLTPQEEDREDEADLRTTGRVVEDTANRLARMRGDFDAVREVGEQLDAIAFRGTADELRALCRTRGSVLWRFGRTDLQTVEWLVLNGAYRAALEGRDQTALLTALYGRAGEAGEGGRFEIVEHVCTAWGLLLDVAGRGAQTNADDAGAVYLLARHMLDVLGFPVNPFGVSHVRRPNGDDLVDYAAYQAYPMVFAGLIAAIARTPIAAVRTYMRYRRDGYAYQYLPGGAEALQWLLRRDDDNVAFGALLLRVRARWHPARALLEAERDRRDAERTERTHVLGLGSRRGGGGWQRDVLGTAEMRERLLPAPLPPPLPLIPP